MPSTSPACTSPRPPVTGDRAVPASPLGLAAEIAAAIGPDRAATLLSERGGTEIEIPLRAEGGLLAEIVGTRAATAMIDAFGAGKMRLPCSLYRGTVGRRERSMQMLRAGASVRETALACDLSERAVQRHRAQLRRDGLLPTTPSETPSP